MHLIPHNKHIDIGGPICQACEQFTDGIHFIFGYFESFILRGVACKQAIHRILIRSFPWGPPAYLLDLHC